MTQIKDQIKNMKVSNNAIQCSIKDQNKLVKQMLNRLKGLETKMDNHFDPKQEEEIDKEQSSQNSERTFSDSEGKEQ